MRTETTREEEFGPPIILVGPGRSGSTLTEFVLGEHPEVHSIGELSFLLHRLRSVMMEKESYFRLTQVSRLLKHRDPSVRDMPWVDYAAEVIDPSLQSKRYGDWASISPAFDAVRAEERVRMVRVLGQSMANMLIPPELRFSRWLFREIWLGADESAPKIDLLAEAYPDAQFVQSVRNPLKYLKSALNNSSKNDITFEEAVYWLESWLRMVRHSRSVGDKHRYLEFRYEDLVSDGGRTLTRLFNQLGLEVHPHCLRALQVRVLPSSGPDIFPERQAELVERVEGLGDEMEALGYPLPN